MTNAPTESATLLILGASGDLAARLLMPGLGGMLTHESERRVQLVGAGTEEFDESAWRAHVAEAFESVEASGPAVEALLVHEDDPYVNVLGVKGVGEIGITGTAGAIANAIWHATGIRTRRFPIRLEELIAG